ncbi:MAG: polysaccharide pyruvyl transferase family protein [Faecalicoccus sp.]|uniref:polysaccharide pyruvyl transferase family protein n=1 Tax=Faecalicoccus sp. TaxID=1971758 RepID=UPI002A90FA2D|nr:polysaccharide pyruvyl transferase family protein [Faecalicoccus sp.]MDY5232267.1 polysaccharide pyruvyl transferase family protein [Faecalicoccus sp.]
MKIGIITWFRYENYGTKLQAIALQNYLRRYGHNVQMIDFPVPSSQRPHKKKKILTRVYGRISYEILKYAHKRYNSQLARKTLKMEQVINEQCIVTDPIKTDEDYVNICNQFNLLICGSDQIWNPNWYHPYYYADFPEIKAKKISYAPSIGIREIPEKKKELIGKSLKSFSLITVRENKASALLETIIGYKPQKVLDPTMLLTKEQWINLFSLKIKKKQRYILCYFLSDNRNHWTVVRKLAKEKNMSIRIIAQTGFSYFYKGRKYMDAGVKEFLDLILNADYILTDSFHGTVFSLLFEKEVYTFERFQDDQFFSQNDRVRELMDEFEISDHLLKYNTRRITCVPPINYITVDHRLSQLREKSATILNNGILK